MAGNCRADRRDITPCLGQGLLQGQNLAQEKLLRALVLAAEEPGPVADAAPSASPSGTWRPLPVDGADFALLLPPLDAHHDITTEKRCAIYIVVPFRMHPIRSGSKRR